MKKDLSSLTQGSAESVSEPSMPWGVVLAKAFPWLLAVAFLGLLYIVLGERIWPVRAVSLSTVVSVPRASLGEAVISKVSAGSGESKADASKMGDVPKKEQASTASSKKAMSAPQEVLFQASGWLEPEPYVIRVPVLVDGIVERVEVLEGELVKKGQVLARLIAEDFQLDLDTAKFKVLELQQKLQQASAWVEAAEAKWDHAKLKTSVEQARLKELDDLYERYVALPAGTVSEQTLSQLKLKQNTQKQSIKVSELDSAQRAAELKVTQGDLQRTKAELSLAQTAEARAQLALDRTVIRSPMDGRIMRLSARPGQRKMLHMDHEDAATVAIVYDPKQVQARLDVPLAEVQKLKMGQDVRLKCSAFPSMEWMAVVTRWLGEADLQRNTLEVKVSLTNPDPRLRPDMLVRAEFLGSSLDAEGVTSSKAGDASSELIVYVPESALMELQQDKAVVWSVDASGQRVTKTSLSLGRDRRDGFVQVLKGLLPGDRVVDPAVEGLKLGERIRELK